MPMYPYVDKETGYQILVQRSMAEYKTPPTEEELPADERGKERDWKLTISKDISVEFVQGRGKGNWGSM